MDTLSKCSLNFKYVKVKCLLIKSVLAQGDYEKVYSIKTIFSVG